jgi:ADP-heptose:LPS heptosyltransferase/SAM-dependent methyltransferase
MRIRVVREEGGLGDMIGIMSVCQGIKKKYPDCTIDMCGPESYREVFKHCPSVDRFRALCHGIASPRRHSQLKYGVDYLDTHRMFCPAGDYEMAVRDEGVKVGRIRLWCQAAGVEESAPVWTVLPEEEEFAKNWREEFKVGDTVVGLQCYSASAAKHYSHDEWLHLVNAINRTGITTVGFGYSRIETLPFHVVETGRSISQVAAMIQQCDAFLSPDSGLFHLASAVGTPHLGIFAQTSGELTSESYGPECHWIQGPVPTSYGRCRPPCYRSVKRGFSSRCTDEGCSSLKEIRVGQILEALNRTIPYTVDKEALRWEMAGLDKLGTVGFFDHEYFQGGSCGYSNYNREWPIHKAIALMLDDVFRPKKRSKVLDIGGACGYHVSILSEVSGCIPHVVDGSEWAIANCDRLVRGRAFNIDIGQQTLPFPSAHFGFVYSTEVLEHVPEERVGFALGEFARVMRPDSLGYITVCYGNPGDDPGRDKSHITLRPKEWWEDQIHEAGLEILQEKIDAVYNHTSVFGDYAGKQLARVMGWNVFVVTPVK